MKKSSIINVPKTLKRKLNMNRINKYLIIVFVIMIISFFTGCSNDRIKLDKLKQEQELYQNKVVEFFDDNIELDVNIDPYSETIWLTQSQMAILFGVDISRISRHIKNALNEEEINSQRNLRKTQIANSDKLVYLYDLDVIISVGYRVKSINEITEDEQKTAEENVQKITDKQIEIVSSVVAEKEKEIMEV